MGEKVSLLLNCAQLDDNLRALLINVCKADDLCLWYILLKNHSLFREC